MVRFHAHFPQKQLLFIKVAFLEVIDKNDHEEDVDDSYTGHDCHGRVQ